jgi:hypothetical protein
VPRGVSKYRKLENHPDFDEIVRLLEEGEPALTITHMLEERYPADKKMHLEPNVLGRYRKTMAEPDDEDDEEPDPIRGEDGRYVAKPKKEKKAKKEDAQEKDIGVRLMVLTGKEPPPPEPRRHVDDSKLMSWVNGVDGFDQFVRDMVIERGIHIELQDYQREVAQAFMDYTRVVVCTGGQVGKDLMILSYSLWLALTNPGSSQLILCSTQTQSVGLMDRTLENINMDSELAACVANIARKPEYVLYFTNGSRIYYLTAKSRIAGKTNILCVWINEARDIREEEVTRVTPLLGVAGGKLYVLSRPRFRQGYFWDIYSECLKNPRFKAFQISTFRNKYFDKQVYADDLATLSPDLFKIEYLGEFADAGSSYFSEVAIDKCSKVEYDYKGMNPEPEYDYSLGIDWARLRDTCVLTVTGKRRIHLKGEPDFKVFHLFSFSPEGSEPSTFDHHFAYIQVLDNRFHFHHIIPESSGMGIPLSDRLEALWKQEHRFGAVKPYENRSLQAKLDMYNHTKYIIEAGDLEIPRNADRLINELKMTNFGTTLHGTLRIETTITDDYADSLCLSLMAWKRVFDIGVATVKLPSAQPDIFTRG